MAAFRVHSGQFYLQQPQNGANNISSFVRIIFRSFQISLTFQIQGPKILRRHGKEEQEKMDLEIAEYKSKN